MNRFALIAAFGVLSAASQAVVLYSTSFEGSEGFAPGNIAGQSGWDPGSDVDTSVVNTTARTGTQSILIDTDAPGWPSGSGWSWINITPNYNAAARPIHEKVLRTSAYFFIESGVNDLGAVRRFGFDAYSPATRIAFARVRSDTGQVELLSGVAGSTVQTSVATFARNTWIELALELDYINNVARAYVDGVDSGLSAAIDGTSTVNDVDLYANESVPAGGLSQGRGFVDDYKIEAVPEPATLSAIGLGLLMLRKRRRA